MEVIFSVLRDNADHKRYDSYYAAYIMALVSRNWHLGTAFYGFCERYVVYATAVGASVADDAYGLEVIQEDTQSALVVSCDLFFEIVVLKAVEQRAYIAQRHELHSFPCRSIEIFVSAVMTFDYGVLADGFVYFMLEICYVRGVHYARIHKPCRRFFVVVGNRICDVGSQIYFYAVEVVRQYFSQIVVEVVELNDIGKGAVRFIFMAAVCQTRETLLEWKGVESQSVESDIHQYLFCLIFVWNGHAAGFQ